MFYVSFSSHVLKAEGGAQSPLYLNQSWKWMPCRVLEYDNVAHKYLIEFKINKKQKRVKRLNVKFEAEDE